jgi:hypothetical protein
MHNEPLIICEEHPESRRRATFEDNGTSAWLYLSDPAIGSIIADAWVYNRVPPPPISQLPTYRPDPPPAAEGYARPESLYEDPTAHHWQLQWSNDGESVAVLCDGVALAMIAQATKRCYSRNLIKTGPWGNVWDEALFLALISL